MVSALGRVVRNVVRQALTTPPPAKAPTDSTTAPKRNQDSFAPARTVGVGASSSGATKQYMRTSDGTPVVPQREAGDFYCEHTAWTLNSEASKKGSSIVKDSLGKPLAGFLHLPGKLDAPDSPTRHRASQEVIGSAFRGEVNAIRAGNPKTSPVKLMLTGYGPFEGVTNNPTGDFVSHRENLDAAMKAGFGKSLLSATGKPVQTPAGEVLEYRVKDAKTGKPFTVQVLARQLDVADSAIDGGPKSVQALLERFKPQGALSLGVDPGSDRFEAVVRTDKGGLTKGPDGLVHHDDAKMHGRWDGNTYVPLEIKDGQIFNDALGRAIQAGNAASK